MPPPPHGGLRDMAFASSAVEGVEGGDAPWLYDTVGDAMLMRATPRRH